MSPSGPPNASEKSTRPVGGLGDGGAGVVGPGEPPSPNPPTGHVLFSDAFGGPDGLITNEDAYFDPGGGAPASADWEMTSGSLFRRSGTGWTGVPDSCPGASGPNATSSNCTDSDVFRLTTKKPIAGDARVALALFNRTTFSGNCDGGDTCWHGVHVWVRYKTEQNLYYASVNRADGDVVIKRKVPCGPDNGGTYIELTPEVHHAWSAGTWQRFAVSVRDNADGSVRIELANDLTGQVLVTGTDKGGTNPTSGCGGAAYAPITGSGAIGVRGDFDEFQIDDVVVTALG